MIELHVATEPGEPGAVNEDFYLALPDLVGVFDGVSSPAGLDTGCVHGTAWYTRQLALSIAKLHQHGRGPLPEIVADAIGAVARSHENTCDVMHPGTPQTTVALVRVSRNKLDYFVLSDATFVADHGGPITVITDLRLKRVAQNARRAVFSGQSSLGTTEHASRIRALAIAKRYVANTVDGYWIAAADPRAAYHAIAGVLPRTGPRAVKRIGLLTDGVSCVVDGYRLMSWTDLLDLAHNEGPQAVIATARKAEAYDPSGTQQPRTKCHDDATIAYGLLTSEDIDA